MNEKRRIKGFTLIELLVVIAIIGMLSSIILASLNTARNKAKDASLKSELQQFATLAELEYSTNNSYVNLQPLCWMNSTSDCDACFTAGPNAATARSICYNIIQNGYNNPNFPHVFFAGNNVNTSNTYSFMVALPGEQTYYCIGGSGGNSDTTPDPVDNWARSGCYNNP